MHSFDELVRRCVIARNAMRDGAPLPMAARDQLGEQALPYVSLARRGMRYAARSDSSRAPSAELLLHVDGMPTPDPYEQIARYRLALLTDRSVLETPHPDALLAFAHTRAVFGLLPAVAPRLLPHWPLRSGLSAPRSGVELTHRLLELETAVSRLAAGIRLAPAETHRTAAFFEVAALRPEQLRTVMAEL